MYTIYITINNFTIHNLRVVLFVFRKSTKTRNAVSNKILILIFVNNFSYAENHRSSDLAVFRIYASYIHDRGIII